MRPGKQYGLFDKPPVVKVVVTYASLSVHEKINWRANQCMSKPWVYRSRYNYYHHPLRHEVSTHLTAGYWWHYRANSGRMNLLDNYLKKKKEQSYTIF